MQLSLREKKSLAAIFTNRMPEYKNLREREREKGVGWGGEREETIMIDITREN
jgi:hypothetical protein